MTGQSAQHSTIILARTYNAPIARVFAAVSDPGERARVFAGNGIMTIEFAQSDLRIGGRDSFLFGHETHRRFRGETIYHDIVPERRIVCTDIVYADDNRLWIGVATLEFIPVGHRTQLKVSVHMVWLDDAENHEGSDGRYAALLEALERYFN